ncbi:MAG: hypothetical protein OXG35_05455 [Acidobacteria bacterium]|nr:hypothetical protein [Acidobacteriota bacterium]
MSTPTPDTRPGAPGETPASNTYTRADKARDHRLVAKALLTIGIAGTALTSLAPQGMAPRLSDWGIVVMLSLVVAWKTTGAWKRRALLQAAGLAVVLLASLPAGPAGAWIFLAGMGVLTLTAACDAVGLMWTDPTTTPSATSPPDTREDPGTTEPHATSSRLPDR